MKKKILTILLAGAAAATMLFTMAGCGGSNDAAVNLNTPDSTKTMAITEVKEKGIEGLCSYLEGNGCLADYTMAANGKYFDMLAEVIGAHEGRKYYFNIDDSMTLVEVYEYDEAALKAEIKELEAEIAKLDQEKDAAKLTELDGKLTSKKKAIEEAPIILADAKDDGQFVVHGDGGNKLVEVQNAVVSKNEKYLMFMGGTKESDATAAFREKLNKCFNDFADQEDTIKVADKK